MSALVRISPKAKENLLRRIRVETWLRECIRESKIRASCQSARLEVLHVG